MTKLEFIDKINDILIGLNTAESDALGSLYDELLRSQWIPVGAGLPPHRNQTNHKFENDFSVNCFVSDGKDVDTGYYDYRLRKWNCEFLICSLLL